MIYISLCTRGLRAVLEYNSDLFDDATIHRILVHFENLIRVLVADPDRRVSDFPLFTEAERHQLLVEWNDTKRDYPKDRCIHQLFEEQVERTPDSVAVVFEDQQLSYRELNERSNQAAHYLKKLGVGSEVRVGICLERSLEMVVGILGVLKAGGVYVPLDPQHPKERLSFMLKDTQARVLLTQEKLVAEFDHQVVVSLDKGWEKIAKQSKENPDNKVTPENLMYVMYTSGSTGKHCATTK